MAGWAFQNIDQIKYAYFMVPIKNVLQCLSLAHEIATKRFAKRIRPSNCLNMSFLICLRR